MEKKEINSKQWSKWVEYFYPNNKLSLKRILIIYLFTVFLLFLPFLPDFLNQTKINPLFLAVIFGLPLISLAFCFLLVYIEKNTKMNFQIFILIMVLVIPIGSLLGYFTLDVIINKKDYVSLLVLYLLVFGSFVMVYLYIKITDFIRKLLRGEH